MRQRDPGDVELAAGPASAGQEELDSTVRRELDALDRALAGEAVAPDLESVAVLARELRAARPEPVEPFAAALDERAAEGFLGAAGASPLNRLRGWLATARPVRLLAPAGAVATLAIVVSVAVIQSGGVDGGPRDLSLRADDPVQAPPPGGTAGGGTAGLSDPASAGEAEKAPAVDSVAAGGAGSAVAEDAAAPGGAGGAVAEDAAHPAGDAELLPAPPIARPSDGLAPGRRSRAVERSATLELSTEPDEFADVTDGVIGVTDRYRGFVVSSQESSSGETSRATFELAVPSQRLQQALADLSALAHVEARTEGSLDITAPTVSARARLADARAEVTSLRRQLAEADTAEETQEIRARLDVARSQAAGAKAEAQRLARRARYATLAVTVTADGTGDGEWGVGEALDDIGNAFSTAAGVALVSLAILLPFGLLVVLVAVTRRHVTRRARERTLD
jgi:hypothetical protein